MVPFSLAQFTPDGTSATPDRLDTALLPQAVQDDRIVSRQGKEASSEETG
jgi:hypothetical protein